MQSLINKNIYEKSLRALGHSAVDTNKTFGSSERFFKACPGSMIARIRNYASRISHKSTLDLKIA